MSTVIPNKTEKCKGAMLATAIGDAMGWPNEPRSKNRAKNPKVADHFVEWTRSSNNPRWHDEKILAGEYSDDTQLTLSVARSIISGDWEKSFSEKELPFWLDYERGGGGALLRAAKSCKENKLQLWQTTFTKGYFNAGGNGSAMRILPHVIAAANTSNISSLMLDIIKDTLVTHGHPRAFLGATCYAYALDYLLRKKTVLEYGELVSAVIDGQNIWTAKPDSNVFGNWLRIAYQQSNYDFFAEWDNTRIRMLQKLDFIKKSLKKGLIIDDIKVLTELECFGKSNGAGDVAILVAIYLVSKYANNPTLAIKIPAFSFGADTDTIASITGGLTGMLNGTNWIPTEWKKVQDYDCIIKMTDLLLFENKKDSIKSIVTENQTSDYVWETTPIGKVTLIDSKSVSNGNHGVVIIKKWRTSLDQTLYTKSFHPNESQPQFYQQPTLYNLSKPTTEVQTFSPSKSMEKGSVSHVNNTKRQFILDNKSIKSLLNNPQFKQTITIGKILKIIQILIEGDEASDILAKKFQIEPAMINLIKDCMSE